MYRNLECSSGHLQEPCSFFQRVFYSLAHSTPFYPLFKHDWLIYQSLSANAVRPFLKQTNKMKYIVSANMGKRCGIHGITALLFERLHQEQDSHMLPVSVSISRSEWSSEISPIQSVCWLHQLIHIPTAMKALYWGACCFHTPPWSHLTYTVFPARCSWGCHVRPQDVDVRTVVLS